MFVSVYTIQDCFPAVPDLYMKIAEGFMFVYSITNQASFNDLEALYDKLCHVKCDFDVPIVLVGSKCDLEDERVVGRDQGEDLARQWGRYCSFMEVSAKERINITEAFYELLHLVQEKVGKMTLDVHICGGSWVFTILHGVECI